MGLKGGPTGAKAFLKESCTRAFRRFDDLESLRDEVLHAEEADEEVDEAGERVVVSSPNKRDQTAVFLDGNVLLMSVPESVSTINGFCDVVYGYIRAQLATGGLIIVVFDEPKHLTEAKRAEQRRRDAARASHTTVCSEDMATCPLADDFTAEQLNDVPDVHALKADRKCRSRLYDEVIRRVLKRASGVMDNWTLKGYAPGVLVFDGVDVRGCERNVDEPRETTMIGTNDGVVAAFQRTVPIGEGDLKLIALDNRLRELVATDAAFADFRLAVTVTSDTDSFAISLLDVAKRRVEPCGGPIHSVFAMREPPTKREREASVHAKASFLCADVALLEGLIQEHLWSKVTREPTPSELLNSMTAFCAATALCGCDFVECLKGSRFDHVYESLPSFIACEPQALAKFSTALDADPVVARQACSGLYRVCINASEHMQTKPRYGRQAQSVREVSDALLGRALWTASYWAQVEHRENLVDWGFAPDTLSG